MEYTETTVGEYTVRTYINNTEHRYPIGTIHNPSKVNVDSSKTWWKNSVLHRLDGQALVSVDGSKIWYQDGKRHRLDGPAAELSVGDKYWYQNGKHHRTDGPAVIYANGDKSWYFQGLHVTCKTQEEFTRLIRLKAFW